MKELNTDLLILSVFATFGLIWYQFGVLWALGVVGAFIFICIWLSYKYTKSTMNSEAIVIIHPDPIKFSKEEEKTIFSSDDYNNLMENFSSKYKNSGYSSLNGEKFHKKLNDRIRNREVVKFKKERETKEISMLEDWFGMDSYEEDDSDDANIA